MSHIETPAPPAGPDPKATTIVVKEGKAPADYDNRELLLQKLPGVAQVEVYEMTEESPPHVRVMVVFAAKEGREVTPEPEEFRLDGLLPTLEKFTEWLRSQLFDCVDDAQLDQVRSVMSDW